MFLRLSPSIFLLFVMSNLGGKYHSNRAGRVTGSGSEYSFTFYEDSNLEGDVSC